MENNKAVDNNLLSLIVPVYNTPIPHLERLFNSLENQSDSNFDLFVIDDGSDSACAQFLDSLKNRFKKIEVIHTKNQGVSAARNIGIDLVRTPYLTFSDSDDEYYLDFVKEANKYILSFPDTDIIYGTLDIAQKKQFAQSANKVEVFTSESEFNELKKALLLIEPRKLNYRILNSPCARIYSSKIAKQIKFNPQILYSEDQIFNRLCIKISKKIMVVPNHWYKYYMNNYSATHSRIYFDFEKYYVPTVTAWHELNLKEPDDFKKSLYLQLLILILTAYKCAFIPLGKISFKDAKKIIDKLSLLQAYEDTKNYLSNVKDLSLKHKLMLWCLDKKRYKIAVLFVYFYNFLMWFLGR